MAGKDKMVKCYDCKHGKYMQWMKNPVICECRQTGERYVAEARRLCGRFEEHTSRGAPEITHYSHY